MDAKTNNRNEQPWEHATRATSSGATATAGIGNIATRTNATIEVQKQTRAALRNLSGALLTSEFHSACNSAAPSTAARTPVVIGRCAFVELSHNRHEEG